MVYLVNYDVKNDVKLFKYIDNFDRIIGRWYYAGEDEKIIRTS